MIGYCYEAVAMKLISRAHFLRTLLASLALLPEATALGRPVNQLRGDIVG